MSSDVRDILGLEPNAAPEITKDAIMGIKRDTFKKKIQKDVVRRPEGMHRELFALLYSSEGSRDLPPLMQSDADKGYKSVKAKLGMKSVRPWKWMPFTNPARSDKAVFYHWRRQCDEGKEYQFAVFNKKVNILRYTDMEYSEYLVSDSWTRVETDSLFDLCEQFDLRWYVIHDRWQLSDRSIEEMKDRYYEVTNAIKKCRNIPGLEGKLVHYDADHETRRKLQLNKLYERTPKQIEEEQHLHSELRKIEARKKEREKKTQDLQKLITAENTNTVDSKKLKVPKKKFAFNKVPKTENIATLTSDTPSSGIKFPDLKSSGVSLRSSRMKLPANIGQKKAKAIEQLLTELGLESNPMPVEEMCQKFNDLRSDLVAMYDLRTVLLNYNFELQTLKHQYQNLRPGKVLEIPEALSISLNDDSPSRPRGISEVIDSVASPSTPNRKRKAALEQNNILKKMKARLS